MRCKEFQEAPPLTNTHKRDMLRVEKSATNTSCQMTALHSPSPPTTRLWRRLQRKETTKSIQVTPPTRQQWHNTTWWTMQCWLSWGFCSEDESMCTLPSAVQIVNQQGAHAFNLGFYDPFREIPGDHAELLHEIPQELQPIHFLLNPFDVTTQRYTKKVQGVSDKAMSFALFSKKQGGELPDDTYIY